MIHVADRVDRAIDAILLVEKLARALTRSTGREYDGVRLKRELDFFRESLKLSRQLIESFSCGKKGIESWLPSLWSIPSEARIMALYRGDYSLLLSVPSRFPPESTFFQEIIHTDDAFEGLATAGLPFDVPPTCRLGEALYRYRYELIDQEERSRGQ
ncbi:MAG: hypothetical protein GTN70_04625 [Deltaproteobacteria bacterium]|nr:hypothetical protein [Deltaproteobacteria bacterium]